MSMFKMLFSAIEKVSVVSSTLIDDACIIASDVKVQVVSSYEEAKEAAFAAKVERIQELVNKYPDMFKDVDSMTEEELDKIVFEAKKQEYKDSKEVKVVKENSVYSQINWKGIKGNKGNKK